MIRNYAVPVPPLRVQEEIVRILDLFLGLEGELQSELLARRRQYAHYRDTILSALYEGDAVPLLPIGEVARVLRGASPRPIHSFLTDADSGVPWIKIGDVAKGSKYITGTDEYVTLEGAAKSRRVRPGDLISFSPTQ